MKHTHTFQQLNRKRLPSTATPISFAQPTRPFVPISLSSTHERPAQVAQLRHSLDRISIQSRTPEGRVEKENQTGLPESLKTNVESLSGLSLDDVHVHFNSPKPASVDALAYTQGTEIYVGPGQEQHLPHEIWHVVQQKQGRVKTTLQAKGVAINDDKVLESEADVMGAKAKRMTAVQSTNEDVTKSTMETHKDQEKLVQMTSMFKGKTERPFVIQRVDAEIGPENLKSEEALAAFQSQYGGNSQGTLVMVQVGSEYYMTEQQTNNLLSAGAQSRDITYIPQARDSGYHAEMRFVAYANEEGIPLNGATIWVSKPICKDCKDFLEEKGVKIETSTSNEQYRNWKSPEDGYTRVESTGVYIGRRSEIERLQDWPDTL